MLTICDSSSNFLRVLSNLPCNHFKPSLISFHVLLLQAKMMIVTQFCSELNRGTQIVEFLVIIIGEYLKK